MRSAFSAASLSPMLNCVQAHNQYECMRWITAGRADLVRLDDTDIYAAGKFNNLVPILKESKFNDSNAPLFQYKAVIVVRLDGPVTSLQTLKNRRSCHTGVGKTVGWTVPVSNLAALGLMEMAECDNSVKAVASFFNQSCAPGAFLPINNLDGNNPTNICSLCDKPSCPLVDKYSGYVGAFRCLFDGRGDVAFVKHSTIDAAAEIMLEEGKTVLASDYRLLCPDGSLQHVNEWDSCNWATRPVDAIVTSRDKTPNEKAIISNLIQQGSRIFNKTLTAFQMYESDSFGGSNLLFTDGTKQLISTNVNESTYASYLGKGYLNTMETYSDCSFTFRWCVVSSPEMQKCQDLRAALASKRVIKDMTCVLGSDHVDCMEKVNGREADLFTGDGGDIYTGGRYHKLVPIISENYPGMGDDVASYWTVAVVRRNNSHVNINNLRGKTSCHTGIQKSSGWNIPIGLLVEKGEIHVGSDCDVAEAVGNFFSKSCVPGALNRKYNPTGRNPVNLCALCGGIKQCRRDHENKYYGYDGSFRCLVETNADVAFMKHLTVPANTDRKNLEHWAGHLKSSDFELLCLDGSRKSVDRWKECNLAQVPAHAVLTSSHVKQSARKYYFHVLQRAQDYFSNVTEGQFSLFTSMNLGTNLMFKDHTTKLSFVAESMQNYETYLGEEYVDAMEGIDLHRCQRSAAMRSGHIISVGYCLLPLFLFIEWQYTI